MTTGNTGGFPAWPIPDDFRQVGARMLNAELCQRYDVSLSTLSRWRRETGIPSPHNPASNLKLRRAKPMPDDFQDRMGETIEVLCAAYKVTWRTVRKWRRACGYTPPVAPPPSDFGETTASMCMSRLCRHYHVTPPTIRRWEAETGAYAIAYIPERQERPEKQTIRRSPGRPKAVIAIPGRDTTLHGSAAEHLRRYAPVYRCRERGMADPEGEFYRYGFAVLSPDEMLRRAERNGWEAAR